MKFRNTEKAMGAAAPKAPPLKGEASITIFVATELWDGRERFGYVIELNDKIVAEPKQTFRTRKEVFRHADGVLDDLLGMFGSVEVRQHNPEQPKLIVIDGGLADVREMITRDIEAGPLRLAA